MQDIADRYRQENGARLIEISLNKVQQLFNSLDPSPFHEKDLDAEAETYIVGAVREFHLKTPLRLIFHLPEAEMAAARTARLADSIHGYFAYRRDGAGRDLRFLLRQGRLSLVIGLAFLAVCLSARAVLPFQSASAFQTVAAEGLVIAGWVAMWRPIQIFLYDWWPLRHMVRIYDKLANIGVDVRATTEAGTRA